MTSIRSPRSLLWSWVPLLIGWLPICTLLATMIFTAHADVTPLGALLVALRMVAIGAVLGMIVQGWTARHPWPHPFRPGFLIRHIFAACLYSSVWVVSNILIEGFLSGHIPIIVMHAAEGAQKVNMVARYSAGPYLVLGVWLYVMVAGVTYASQESARAALAEAAAARAHLAALRSQLNPHFLFNVLHSIVQLIPREPAQAATVAERMAGLLRHSLEEDRDLVPLESEWRFVERYLELESMRFGERLRWNMEHLPTSIFAIVPTFALQTLVENAVRHGAAPRVETTTIDINARIVAGDLIITVIDDGAGLTSGGGSAGAGTGLVRLRERLAALYGERARLVVDGLQPRGARAELRLPLETDET